MYTDVLNSIEEGFNNISDCKYGFIMSKTLEINDTSKIIDLDIRTLEVISNKNVKFLATHL